MRKSKVEKSTHFEEIVARLSEGESARSVSKWLKNTYDEDISHAALSRYYNNNISMEDRVEAELNRRAEEKKKKLQEENEKAQKEKQIQQEADKIEAVEETVNTVAETIADNMQGVAKVASELPDMFSKTKADAANPDVPNVTFKDAANLTIQANKIFAEYFKDNEPDVTVNVDNHVLSLEESLERTRQKYQEAKNRG